MIKTIRGKIAVKIDEKEEYETTDGGIITSTKNTDMDIVSGKVVSTGDNEDIELDDVVYFYKHSAIKIEDVYILRAYDVLAID